MKRFLLIAACSLFAAGMQAQTTETKNWETKLTGVASHDNLYKNAPTAVDNAGNTYMTGQFDQAIAIGDAFLEPVANSAYLAKYDANGKSLWAVSLAGAATISCITTDDKNNVYIAGTLADKVIVGSTDGQNKDINGKEGEVNKVTSFIAAYNAEGVLQTVKTIYAETPASIMESGLYFPDAGYPYFRIQHIEVDGGKLYASAIHTGDVALGDSKWGGAYLNVFDFMYQDIPCAGIISMNATGLNGETSVAHVGAVDQISNEQMGYESLNFTVDNGTVYLCFVGNGNIKSEVAGQSETFSFSYDGPTSSIEHGYVLTSVKNGTEVNTKVLHATPHTNLASFDIIGGMKVEDGVLYIAGTFQQQLVFDPSKTATDACDLYATALNKETMDVIWTSVSGVGEGEGDSMHFCEVFNAMEVNNGEVFLYGYAEEVAGHKLTQTLNFTCSNGQMTKGSDLFVTGAAINGTTKAVLSANLENAETSLATYKVVASGIQSTTALGAHRVGNTFYFAEPNDIAVYNMQGCMVKRADNATSISIDDLNRGVYILSNGKDKMKALKANF